MKIDKMGYFFFLCVFLIAGCAFPDVKYVAFGNSQTELYAPYLAYYLDVEGNLIANQGEGGEETDEGLKKLNQILLFNQYPNAEVFILIEGGGDIVDWLEDHDPFLLFSPSDPAYPFKTQLLDKLGEIKENLADIVMNAQDEGWIVFMHSYVPFVAGIECPPLPFDTATEQQAARANEYRSMLNEAIREVASLTEAILIDTGENPLLDDVLLYENCNHLNEEGNQIVAQQIADAIIDD